MKKKEQGLGFCLNVEPISPGYLVGDFQNFGTSRMWEHSKKKRQTLPTRESESHRKQRDSTPWNVRPPGTMARNLMSKNRCCDSHRCLCSAGVARRRTKAESATEPKRFACSCYCLTALNGHCKPVASMHRTLSLPYPLPLSLSRSHAWVSAYAELAAPALSPLALPVHPYLRSVVAI